ncbi:MAG: cytochrome c [Rhodospirillaceae bacterium]
MLAVTLPVGASQAQETIVAPDANPMDYVAYRKAVMAATQGHMNAMVTYLKSGIQVENQIATHASAISALAISFVQSFPEGTAEIGETRALPKIWEEIALFQEANVKAQTAAARLAEAAITGADKTDLAALLQTLGAACQDCHDAYYAAPASEVVPEEAQ